MFLRATRQSRAVSTRDILFPAPTRGWVQSGNITTAGRDQAEVLDNFFPTAQGAEIRGGSSVYATIGTAIVRLFVHSGNADSLFASTASGIYDADRINAGGSAFADVTGLGSGDWSVTQISTTGGQFAFMVNGVDYAQYYDGTEFRPISTVAVNDLDYDNLTTNFAVGETVTGSVSAATATILGITQTSATTGTLRLGTITGGPYQDNETLTSASGLGKANGADSAATAITITNVLSENLSQAWLFKERIFAVEKNSLSAWYLPVKSIGGAATEIPLGAVFRRGGELLFGATWSLDSGSGLDDVCLFVSTLGEIAVYQGTDPSSASTWALVGVYDIDAPLNKHSSFKAGGDQAILTGDGIISVASALKQDRAALQVSAITAPIEDAWKDAVANGTNAFPITATLWQSQAKLIIGVPVSGQNVSYVSNAKTGAWCRYTGWDVRCSAVSGDLLFFATSAGIIMQAEDGGDDNGIAYTGVYVPKFTTAESPGVKVVNHAAATIKTAGTPVFTMKAMSDYSVSSITAPSPIVSASGDLWGTGVWGTFVWGDTSTPQTYTIWKAVRASGYSFSVGLAVTINQTTYPQFEILSTAVRYETASAL